MKKTIPHKPTDGSVRIIGGQYRGKRLSFPSVAGLRPTGDRIRETVFNWLMHDIRNARCLDAFAGSGALGLEAYSRGAGHVVFIEANPTTCRNLQHNITTFHTPKLQLIQASALDYLARKSDAVFDIVFIDPPFDQPELFTCIHQLEQSPTLRQSGLLYVESPQEIPLNPIYWHKLKLKKTGRVVFALYQKNAEVV